jgi:hypothetical protein
MRSFLKSATVVGLGLAMTCLSAPVLVAGGAGAAATPVVKSVTLTNSSSGSTVVATVGELVVVNLTGGTLRWTEPRVAPAPTGVAPVLVLLSGGTSSNGSSTATFRVAKSGTASITAIGTPSCTGVTATATSPVCTPYVVLWQANVDVPVVDPPLA